MPLLDGPSLGGNARHVLRQYAEENALARGRGANAAGTEEFGGGCLRGRYNNLREVIQNNPSLVVVPSIINAGSIFVQRPICRTNYLPNNSMAGATGSVLPTNWSISTLPAGITVSYSASGTAVAADGTSVNYIDVTVSGTAGASGFLNLRPTPSPSTIAAFIGQSWNTSVYLQLISGSVSGISPTWQLQELNASNTFLQGSNITGLASLAVGGPFERYNVSRVFTDSSTAFTTCRWGHSLVSGTAYSYTIRIGSPQLERFNVPTPMIATSTGAVTRLNESTDVVGLPPDFTVSRNTSATRVNSSGFIETAKTNLALHSEAFDNASWSKTDITVTTGSTSAFTAPDGTTNADLFTSTASGSSFLAQTITIASGAATFSVFAKAGNHGIFRIGNVSSAARAAWFDLNAGAVIGTVNGGTASIQNYGSGWYRCIFTASSVVSGGSTFIIAISDAANGTASVSGATMYAWGAQLEVGSSASEYIPTTTVARTRFAGVTVDGTIAANIPRIDWLGQSCPGLLVEASGQNLALRSEEFTVSGTWTIATGGTGVAPIVTQATGIVDPAGGNTADLIQLNVGSGTLSTDFSILRQSITVTAVAHTFSVYLRSATSGNQFVAIRFDSAPQTILTITPSWQRFTFTGTPTAGSRDFGFDLRGNNTSASGSSQFYAWGAQLEVGSVATTYIPTTSGAVSRAADVISASGALVSGLIGQTEGTIYAEVDIRNAVAGTFISLDIGSTADFLIIGRTSSFAVIVQIKKSSGSTVTIITSSAVALGVHKIALGYTNGDYALYIDGVSAGTSTNSTDYPSAALTRCNLAVTAYNVFNDRIRAAALYTTRLSNAQLAELTRL